MSNYRGLIWSLVAIAGTATAATMAYRYVTRNVRDGGDEDDVSSDNGPTAGRRSSRRSRRRTAGHETLTRTQFVGDDDDDDAAYESLSEGDYDDAFNTYDEYEDDSAMDMVPQQQEQQQMMLVAREGNLVGAVVPLTIVDRHNALTARLLTCVQMSSCCRCLVWCSCSWSAPCR
jgi:hypothetical protein